MFEGLILLVLIVFILMGAGGIGAFFALIISNALPPNQGRRKLRIAVAGMLPPIFAVYLLTCALFAFPKWIPGETEFVFGDILEPLPNGYALKAMGKMSEHGRIVRMSDRDRYSRLPKTMRSLEVDDPIVFGAYSYSFAEPAGEPAVDPGYFALDTRNGSVRDFSTQAELRAYAGHPIQLLENQSFHSQVNLSHRRLMRALEFAIAFGPPLACTALYLLLLPVGSAKTPGP